MATTTVLPGLTITDTMFDAAEDAVARRVPQLKTLTRDHFLNPTRWTLIPDELGEAYKAEITLFAATDHSFMARANVWFKPDLRGNATPKPHSHPWNFESEILHGEGYTEYRVTPVDGELTVQPGVVHRVGTVNTVPRTLYHEVTEVHEPGRTLTLMVCGQGERGTWGYLNLATGQHERAVADPDFQAKLAALNPHQR